MGIVFAMSTAGRIFTMSSKERVKQYRLRQKELGRLKREMYLTNAEHEALKAKLKELRNINK